MRPRMGTLACGLVVLGLLLSTGTALAGGGGGSAGNSQYVDPLSGQPHAGHHKAKPGNTSSGTSTTTSTTTSSSGTLSQSAPSSVGSSATTATQSSHSSAHSSGKTLPFTGLNLWASIALGLGLLGAGLGLRRVLARVY